MADRVAALSRQLSSPSSPPSAPSPSLAPLPTSAVLGPVSNFYISQRLRLHYLDWSNERMGHAAAAATATANGASTARKPLLVLVHGGRDHARSWDDVARRLRDDYHVVAPDLRGHGDSAWAYGGEYQIQEYVLDLAQLLRLLNQFPVTIVGHSMGAVVALQYTGIFPENVHRLVAVEGLGGPPSLVKEWLAGPYWSRMRDWIGQVADLATRNTRRYPTVEAASERMRAENSFLSEEQAYHLTVHGVLRNEDGSFSWKFDNYMRPFMPSSSGHDDNALDSTFARIQCPTLFLAGASSWHADPSKDGRLAPFRCRYRNVVFEDAGHWLHHDQLERFLATVLDFFRDADAGRLG